MDVTEIANAKDKSSNLLIGRVCETSKVNYQIDPPFESVFNVHATFTELGDCSGGGGRLFIKNDTWFLANLSSSINFLGCTNRPASLM